VAANLLKDKRPGNNAGQIQKKQKRKKRLNKPVSECCQIKKEIKNER